MNAEYLNNVKITPPRSETFSVLISLKKLGKVSDILR